MSSLKSDRFLSHSDFLEQNFEKLLSFYLTSLASMFIVLALLWFFFDGIMESKLKKNPNSSAQHYLTYIKSRRGNKWFYFSYIVSILHSIGCVFFTYRGLFSCQPSHKFTGTGLFGNTFVSNEYCVDNADLMQAQAMCFFLSYITFDLCLCLFLVRDTSPGSMQNYIHHILGIGGSVGGLLCGRMILTLSCATLVTEFSTPFVSIRALLSIHKKTSTTFYLVNGLLMTLFFFVCRVVF